MNNPSIQDDQSLVTNFLDYTEQIWSYKSLPAHFMAFHPTSVNQIKIFFYDYNNETMWKLSDLVRSILFLNKDPIYWTRVIRALGRLYPDDSEKIREFEVAYNRWRDKKDFDLEEIIDNNTVLIENDKEIHFRLIHRSKILNAYIKPDSLRPRWEYANMYLNKFKWHNRDSKRYEQLSTFEKKVAYISTVSLIIDSVELITHLRGVCYSLMTDKTEKAKKNKPKNAVLIREYENKTYDPLTVVSKGSIWQGPFVKIPYSSINLLNDLEDDGINRVITISVNDLTVVGAFGFQTLSNFFIYCRSGEVVSLKNIRNEKYIRVSASLQVMGCNVVLFKPEVLDCGRLMIGQEPWERGLVIEE